MFQFDDGMNWGQGLALSHQLCRPPDKTALGGNDQSSLLVPVQSVGLSLVEGAQAENTPPVPITPSRLVDPEETRLSGSDGDSQSKADAFREVVVCSEGEIKPSMSCGAAAEENRTDTSERQRITNSHGRARRAIISAVLPEDVPVAQPSLHQASPSDPEVQPSPSALENEDFSFMQPLSLEFHM